jgi:hypothetical protein
VAVKIRHAARREPAYWRHSLWGKDHEEVELLRLDESGIRVAEYLTELPPRHLLEKKLHEVIVLAREQFAARAEVSAATMPKHQGTKT